MINEEKAKLFYIASLTADLPHIKAHIEKGDNCGHCFYEKGKVRVDNLIDDVWVTSLIECPYIKIADLLKEVAK